MSVFLEVWSFSKFLPPHYHRKEVTKLEKGLSRVGGKRAPERWSWVEVSLLAL